jgi:hypothetical protein
MDPGVSDDNALAARVSRRHLRFGWSAVLVFALVGLTLETLHGFKVRWYLDASNETRRLMWTLAHAHGTLFGILNVLYGLTVAGTAPRAPHPLTSRGLIAAGALLPAGFFFGGLAPYGGDPAPGILLVPIGAILLIAGLGRLVLGWRGGGGGPDTRGAKR